MKKPAQVLLEVKLTDTDRQVITVHVARVGRVQDTGNTERYRPPREIDNTNGDKLAKELERPEIWVEPRENLSITIQTPMDTLHMVDL